MKESMQFLAVIGRVLIGVIFVLGAVSKVLAFDATVANIARAGLPLPTLACLGAITLEGVCGVLFLIGFQVRTAALVLVAFCLVTAFAFHNDFANPLQLTHFIKNFLIIGGLLNFAASGAGILSLDGRPQRVTA